MQHPKTAQKSQIEMCTYTHTHTQLSKYGSFVKMLEINEQKLQLKGAKEIVKKLSGC